MSNKDYWLELFVLSCVKPFTFPAWLKKLCTRLPSMGDLDTSGSLWWQSKRFLYCHCHHHRHMVILFFKKQCDITMHCTMWKLQWGCWHFKERMPLSLSNTIGFAQFPLLKCRKLWEYQWKYLNFLYFSDINAFFGY